MIIEFFTEDYGAPNVRFPGDSFAGSSEVILGVFYDNYSEYEARGLFQDVKKAKSGELSTSEKENYAFGDYIYGTMGADYCTLENIHDLKKSKKYRVRTSDLVKALKRWHEFSRKRIPGASEIVEIDAEVID